MLYRRRFRWWKTERIYSRRWGWTSKTVPDADHSVMFETYSRKRCRELSAYYRGIGGKVWPIQCSGADQGGGSMSDIGMVPQAAMAVILFKHNGREQLIACEAIMFPGGAPAIETVLRRARISGHVRVGGELGDFFADLLDSDGNMIENVALDRYSYRALKTRWMRTKIDHTCTVSR